MVTAEEDSLKQILTRQITTFRRVNDLYRRNFEIHRQHIFEPFAVTEQLQGIGFEVQTLGSYGALQFVPGQTGFLARKPFH
jgi:hypothetical protein